MTALRRAVVVLVLLAAWCAALVALVRLDLGHAPTSWTLQGLTAWSQSADPAPALMSLARWAAVGLCAYLVAVTVVGVLARAVGARAVVRAADRVTIPPVRRLLRACAGAALTVSSIGGAALPAIAEATPTGPPVIRRLDPPRPIRHAGPPKAAGESSGRPVPEAPNLPSPEPSEEVASLGPVDDPEAAQPPAQDTVQPSSRVAADPQPPWPPNVGPAPQPAGDSAPAATEPPPLEEPPPPAAATASPRPGPVADPTRTTWTVQRGESFWSIATAVVGRTDEATVARYWRNLVAANRPKLHDPGNPDLLFIGQVLDLPP